MRNATKLFEGLGRGMVVVGLVIKMIQDVTTYKSRPGIKSGGQQTAFKWKRPTVWSYHGFTAKTSLLDTGSTFIAAGLF